MIEEEFVKQLLFASDMHPEVDLSARFPFHPRLVEPCSKLNLFEEVKGDNVCLVNCTNFTHLIGALGSGIDSRMVKTTSAFLHNSALCPRLLKTNTYKSCPMRDLYADPARAVSFKNWQRWLLVYHTKRHKRRLSLPERVGRILSKKKLTDYTKLQWELGTDREEMEKKYELLEGHCCKQFYQIRLTGDIIVRIKANNSDHDKHKDPLRKMMDIEFHTIVAKSVGSLCLCGRS